MSKECRHTHLTGEWITSLDYSTRGAEPRAPVAELTTPVESLAAAAKAGPAAPFDEVGVSTVDAILALGSGSRCREDTRGNEGDGGDGGNELHC